MPKFDTQQNILLTKQQKRDLDDYAEYRGSKPAPIARMLIIAQLIYEQNTPEYQAWKTRRDERNAKQGRAE